MLRSASASGRSLVDHDARVNAVREQLAAWRGRRVDGERLTLYRGGKDRSNTMRNAGYKVGHQVLDVSALDHIVEVDRQTMRMTVEPCVTMDALFEAAIAAGVIPRVLPEFRKLTVGGLVQGSGLESGSFRVGQFNDQATSYSALLASGEPVTLTPEGPHRDLFFGQTGSFGSLAILVNATLEVIPAKSHVAITYERASSFGETIEALRDHAERGTQDFLEGIMLSPHRAAVIRGRLVDGPGGGPLQRFQGRASAWFYAHADDVTRARVSHEERAPLRDYMFRYDQGAFWMGSYARWKGIPVGRIRAARRLMHRSFSTEALYRKLHRKTEDERARRFLIQDCYIPVDRAADFLRAVDELLGIYPVWLCPIKTASTPQKLSPHFLDAPLCINVGLYGRPRQKEFDPHRLNRVLEHVVAAHGGRKMLYAHAYYTPEEFWKIHDRAWYEQLREQAGARDVLVSVENKVLRNG